MKPSTDHEVGELFAAVMHRHRSTAPGALLARMRSTTSHATVVTTTVARRPLCTSCGLIRPQRGDTCSRCNTTLLRPRKQPCVACNKRIAYKGDTCHVCRRVVLERERLRLRAESERVERVAARLGGHVKAREAQWELTKRARDDAALIAAGYRIGDDYRTVIDTLEGHRVLRSVALSRLAGRAA